MFNSTTKYNQPTSELCFPILDAPSINNHIFIEQIPQFNFPELFWDRLKDNNISKNADTPVAIIFRAQALYDNNAPIDQALIFQIAKTHRVALQAINDATLFGPKIKEIAQAVQQQPDLLIISAHGNSEQIGLGTQNLSNHPIYGEEHISEHDFVDLDPNARIILLSCGAGSGLAQKIANISHRTVIAATGTLFPLQTILIQNSYLKYTGISLDISGVNHMFEFAPNKQAVSFPLSLPMLQNHPSCHAVVDYLEDLAEQDDAKAQYMMGIITEHAADATMLLKPYKTAHNGWTRWYYRAATQGHAQAQVALGRCYEKGNGSPQSHEEAVNWYLRAANQGDAQAQYLVGLCYEQHLGVVLSYETAADWYLCAANQGYTRAQYWLGTRYEQGIGVTQSKTTAANWYLRAATYGNAQAQFALGRCYSQGIGISQSLEDAVWWYRISARQGCAPAQQALQDLKLSLVSPYIGIRFESINSDHQEEILILQVKQNSPAARAGLQQGDIILEYTETTLRDTLARMNPNDQIQWHIRRNDTTLVINITAGSRDH